MIAAILRLLTGVALAVCAQGGAARAAIPGTFELRLVTAGAEPAEILLQSNVTMVRDASGQMQAADAFAAAARGDTIPIATSGGAPYRSNAPHWGLVSLQATGSESNWIVYYRLATIEKLEVYVRSSSGPWLPVTGLHQRSRFLGGYHYPSFALTLPKEERVDLAVRIETRAPIRMALRLVPGYHYYEAQRRDLVVAGMTLAVPLVVLVYLVLLLPSAYRTGIAWFIAFIVFESIGAMWVSGHGHVLLPQISRETWPVVGRVAYTAMIVAGWIHATIFLRAATLPPWLVRIGWAITLGVVVINGLEVLQLANTRNLFTMSVLVFPSFIVGLALYAKRRGVAFAGLYGLAWGAFVVAGLISILGLLGIAHTVAWSIFYAQSSVAALLFGLVAIGLVREQEQALALARREHSSLQAAKQQLEEALQVRLRFFAATNHDLRQPLQTMGLYVDLAAREIRDAQGASANQARASSYLAQAKNAFGSVVHFLDSLLDLARLEGKALNPRQVAIELNPFLARLASEYQALAGGAGLELRYVPTDAHTISDPQLLERMVRNLLANAVRYTNEGGILLGVRAKAGEWRIDVVDTGDGLTAEQQTRLFREFAQIDSNDAQGRARTPGYGLGLSIVKRLAELQGHRVELASRKGRGSRFSLYLPRAPSTTATAQAAPLLETPLGGLRLLVLEDERDLSAALGETLRQAGALVTVVRSVRELRALVPTPERAFHALLTDYRLAQSDTLPDVADHVRAVLRCPIIALTGSTEAQAMAQMAASGVTEVLIKPISAAQLLDAVRRVALST